MAKIFISYSRDSQDVVEELVQDLNDDGHETWFDQRLTRGQSWWDRILSEIRICDIFVAALTPDSLESLACQRELKYADLLQKPLCPVRLSDKVRPEALPHRLAELQWVDYCRRDKLAFKKLQRTIRGVAKAPPLPDPLPDLPAVPRSYLSTLRERIDADSPLEFKDQAQLVFELRGSFRDGGAAEEITDLLHRLKKRDELFAKVARDIDDLLGDINRGQRGSLASDEREPLRGSTSPLQVPRSILSTMRERIETDSPLETKDQAQLVLELRAYFRDGGAAEEITDLLQRLKKRDELFAQVARDIDELLGEINRGQRGSFSNNARETLHGFTSFTVYLAAMGNKKIEVIKEVRAVTGLGLKEAKDLVEAAPKPVKEGVTKEEAEKIKAALEKAGAKVELKSNDTPQEDREDQVRGGGPNNSGANGSKTVTRELVVTVAAELRSMICTWYTPDIPVDKANNARASMKMPADESILVLFDNTLFGSAKDGLLIGVTGLYYRGALWESPEYASWEEFLANPVEVEKHFGSIALKVAGRSWSFSSLVGASASTFLTKLRAEALGWPVMLGPQ